MRKEDIYNEQPAAIENSGEVETAFRYLKSFPPNFDRPALDSYKRDRDSQIIDHKVAEDFTTSFRGVSEPFYIPVSWTLTKSALVSLLGITSYEDYSAVNGVRFYAGLNGDNQLTLIAVSTMAGPCGCNDDLTVEDEYPYYDYANPCPSNCSSRGNLRTESAVQMKVTVTE